MAWHLTRDESARRADAQLAGDAENVLAGVQTFLTGVDRVIANLQGTAGAPLDADTFRRDGADEVEGSSLIEGVALIDPTSHQVVALAGTVGLLDAAATDTALPRLTLVGYAPGARAPRLGFARGNVETGMVYVELRVPLDSFGTDAPRFVLTGQDHDDVILASTERRHGLRTAAETVTIGGVRADLMVESWGNASLLGLSLASLVLLAGLATTAALTAACAVGMRRGRDLAQLEAENTTLDHAVSNQGSSEHEPRASEERWREILRDSPDVLALLDRRDFSLELLNRTSFLGHRAAELAAPEGLWRILEPEDRRRLSWVSTVSASTVPEELTSVTVRLRGADHVTRWFMLRVTALVGPDATHSSLLVTWSDVHDRWERQEERARLGGSLRDSHHMQTVGEVAVGMAPDLDELSAARTRRRSR
jgi:PAS domain-containing protein